MDWQEIGITTEPEAIEAVADLFYQMNFGGVVIEDPQLLKKMTQSGQWDAFEFPEESLNQLNPVVKGYLPINEELLKKLEELRCGLDEIALRLGQQRYDISLNTVNEEDWANSWKAYFKPVKISQSLVIRPTWEPYSAQEGEIVLDLDPGMAFGTGNHVTTTMCASFLENYIRPDNVVIDVGTGTGILAMGAALLGAREVLALDYDTVAVKVARENIKQNKLENLIRIERNDLLTEIEKKADLITANIVADIIIKLLPQVKSCLKAGGVFIASGIISERKNDVINVARKLNFILQEEKEQNDWVAQVWKVKEC